MDGHPNSSVNGRYVRPRNKPANLWAWAVNVRAAGLCGAVGRSSADPSVRRRTLKPEGGHHCEFNNAIKITEGHVGDVKVDGAKVWLSGNLGGDFSKGSMKGAVMTFDTEVTPKQQEAIKFLMGKIYPVKWEKMEIAVAPIVWERNGENGHAKLGKGEAEVVLTGVKGADGQQSVLKNVAYWGAQKNGGFMLAKSEHHYKGHGYNYKYKDRNGFMISIESSGEMEQKL